MIGASEIERAERVLQLMYGSGPASVPRQLGNLQISEEAFAQFQNHRIGTLRSLYGRAWKAMDPRLEPAIGSLLYHFFLVGVVAGRSEGRAEL